MASRLQSGLEVRAHKKAERCCHAPPRGQHCFMEEEGSRSEAGLAVPPPVTRQGTGSGRHASEAST